MLDQGQGYKIFSSLINEIQLQNSHYLPKESPIN